MKDLAIIEQVPAQDQQLRRTLVLRAAAKAGVFATPDEKQLVQTLRDFKTFADGHNTDYEAVFMFLGRWLDAGDETRRWRTGPTHPLRKIASRLFEPPQAAVPQTSKQLLTK